jgi:hypothetical protein
VTSRPSNETTIESVLPAYQLQGFIRVRNSSDQPVLDSSRQQTATEGLYVKTKILSCKLKALSVSERLSSCGASSCDIVAY